jgi:hypothetical protein
MNLNFERNVGKKPLTLSNYQLRACITCRLTLYLSPWLECFAVF